MKPARRARVGVVAAAAAAALAALGAVRTYAEDSATQPPPLTRLPTTMSAEEARASIDRGIKFLLEKQNPDGSWGTSTVESLFEITYSNASFYAWKMAGGALSAMALMAVEETPERRAALDKAMHWLVEQPIPKRGSDWDIDNNWTALYGFNAMVRAAQDKRFQGDDWKAKVQARGIEFYKHLEKNQEPLGGWGYYEGSVVSRRPTWSTSFATACVVPALVDAKRLGWPVDDKVTTWAVDYVRKCRLPSGAYTYDLTPIPRVSGGESINDVKGSLGRIQVGNWALRRAGVKSITDDVIRTGLQAFFAQHRFLDVARMKPVPHEAYYANAGYFYYFGHYHAAQAINLLPPEEREALHARLRPYLVASQWKDGSSIDFVGSFYVYTASTSFSIMALQAGLPPPPEPGR